MNSKYEYAKEWDWSINKDSIWNEPCEESYFYCKKWKKEDGNKLLDLGCGLGRHSILFAQEGFDVTAIDLSEYGVNELNKKKDGLNINTYVCDMHDMPFEDESFDYIWAYHVISHTDTRGFKEVLREIKRVLKPNGEIYISLSSKLSHNYTNENNPSIDQNTVIKMDDGPEKGVPHFYVDLSDIEELFDGFDLSRVRLIDDCLNSGVKKNDVHYYINAYKRGNI